MTGRTDFRSVTAFAAAIFVSAYLLFQVQPMIARQILPWFGGSAAVWNTCLLFFQVALVAGYLYAHLLQRSLSTRRQVLVHLLILTCSLLVLPIMPSARWTPVGNESPSWRIILLLATTVGFPYLMISASGPLLQHWFSTRFPGRSPYRLFAVSNIGSLLGLLCYPFVMEPIFTLKGQSLLWSVGYVIYGVLCVWCVLPLARKGSPLSSVTATPTSKDRIPVSMVVWWIGLAACGSTLLLAVTNQLCQDVAVVPFLWVLPLSLYLISFVLCFGDARWYHRSIWGGIMAITVGGIVWLLWTSAGNQKPLWLQILVYLLALLACCMVCHGELARLKPQPQHLTAFYLMIAIGGALGGLLVNVGARLLFDSFWELYIGIVATWILLGTCAARERIEQGRRWLRRWATLPWSVVLVLLSGIFTFFFLAEREDVILAKRGFYGVLRVLRSGVIGAEDESLSLYSGRIDHGFQYQRDAFRSVPTSYYGYESGIGVAIRQNPRRHTTTAEDQKLKVGVVGLGIGIIAAHAVSGDTFRFYELNPDVEKIARSHFTYLSDAKGNTSVVIGDGRISLERELRETGSQQFDVLALDAFTGDAIPVHLLTREALALYWKHLKPDGILAIHISNLYFDLSDVVRVHAQHFGKTAVLIGDAAQEGSDFQSDWVLLTDNRILIQAAQARGGVKDWARAEPKPVLWTDDYSNLLVLLDLE